MQKIISSILVISSILLVLISCEDKAFSSLEAPIASKDTTLSYSSASVKIVINSSSKNTEYNIKKVNGTPTVGAIDDEFILAAWYSSKNLNTSNGEAPNNYITVALSKNSGRTWKDNSIIVATLDTLDRVFDPCLWKDAENVLHLSWSLCKKEWWDGKGAIYDISIRRFYDKLEISSPRLLINRGIMNTKPFLNEKTSEVWYPVCEPWVGKSLIQGTSGCYVYLSPFNFTNDILNPTGLSSVSKVPLLPKGTNTGYSEAHILKIEDTNYIFIRTTKGISYATTTSDKPDNWSYFSIFNLIGPNPETRFVVRKLKSNKILIVANSSTQRENLTAFLFDERLSKMLGSIQIDARRNVSYPEVEELPNGNILIVYDRERTGAREILLAKVTEEMFDLGSLGTTKVNPQKINQF